MRKCKYRTSIKPTCDRIRVVETFDRICCNYSCFFFLYLRFPTYKFLGRATKTFDYVQDIYQKMLIDDYLFYNNVFFVRCRLPTQLCELGKREKITKVGTIKRECSLRNTGGLF